ncbi:MAG: hypothetical protein H0X62_16995 [Bacteroidetes bacterium]|nr:hypothetical protein [Bacteroidota bacterium]
MVKEKFPRFPKKIKHLPILFFFILLVFHLQAQEWKDCVQPPAIAIELEQMNLLYFGFETPVLIKSDAEISNVSIDNGSIIPIQGYKGRYMVKPDNGKVANILIYGRVLMAKITLWESGPTGCKKCRILRCGLVAIGITQLSVK